MTVSDEVLQDVALEELHVRAEALRRAERRYADALRRAREHGATYEQMSRAAGVTNASLRKRFSVAGLVRQR